MKNKDIKQTRVIKVRAGKDNMFYFTNNALGLCKGYKGLNIEDIKELTDIYSKYDLRFKFY